MTASYRTTPCQECRGTGSTLEARTIAGEWIDADYVEIECDECSGTGEIDAGCASCSRIAPIDDEGFCASCAACSEHIVDEPLSELRSPEGWDIMDRKDAA